MEHKELYIESCNFLRHYSNASLKIRVLAIVNGFILISAWGYVFKNVNEIIFLIFVSLFGLLFTWLLFMMHLRYLLAAKEFAKTAIELENSIGNVVAGPVARYISVRDEIYQNKVMKAITIHATFTLVGIAFVALLILSIYQFIITT